HHRSKPENPKLANPQPAIFIDRDGTINEDIGYVSSPEELILYPWAAEAVRLVNESGLKAIVITNQSGIARRLYTEETLAAIHERMASELARGRARIDAIYYCPHHPEIGDERYRMACECRKPGAGLLLAAAREHGVDLARSFVIGDKASDINLATGAGGCGALVLTGYGRETLANPERWPCEPSIIADNLLEAVRLILDRS
ncbi:MAG TPA: HAD family hydrolase, partial [Blastocatellia bacterium]|nr:HAD family hydrolase [Blastocatellia bacterium]